MLAIAAVLVPTALYPLIGPWALLSVPVVPAVAVALGPRARRPARASLDAAPADRPGTDADPGGQDDRPPAAGTPRTRPRDGRRIRPIALPSAVDDYDLHFSAVVHWRWSSTVDLRLRNPMGPAVLAVVTRAAELVRETDPADEGMAECELAARLAVEHAVIGSGIVVWADEVDLRLSEGDTDRLRRMADLRKDRVVREAARIAEDDLAPLPAARPARAADAPLPVPVDPEGAEGGGAEGPVDLGDLGPGSDVDGEGYESYWWPAEEDGDHGGTERDVQVAILRGMIDSLVPGPERDAFVRDQLTVLERGGFDEVARRIRAGHPESPDPGPDGPGDH
ncbi:hypothetical protein [Nocardiopsis sp. CC223A]|uniref:hypothetical protein n=1 Tax=Nocardiopsis sp. CC223A TaxID=3044051 RepID=UPI00278BE0F2|nr:hypothetical protein [Nocardiopsis sp. CC223A]